MTPQDRTETLLATALAAVARGWSVFPAVPGGKRPAITAWQNRASRDPDRIRRCWTSGRPFNIGIATGPSHLLVIDLDVARPGDDPLPDEYAGSGLVDGADVLADLEGAHGDLPETFTVGTPSGGRHLYFTRPGGVELGNSAGKIGPKIDTRGVGGYVLAPGSTIGSDAYRTVRDCPPAPLPGWVADLLRDRPGNDRDVGSRLPTQAGRRADYVAAAVRAELTRVYTTRPGSRNHSLFVAAAALGEYVAAGLLDRATIYAALSAAADAAGLDQVEIGRTITSGLSTAARHTRRDAA